MMTQEPIAGRFWLLWALAFLGFPLGGLLANLIVGPVTTPLRAALAGAITGAVLGLVQWLVLRSKLPPGPGWVVATSLGMALGLALSAVLLGNGTRGHELLWRAALTGLSVGLAQTIVLLPVLPPTARWLSAFWVGVVSVGWVCGWFITRRAGVDLDLKW